MDSKNYYTHAGRALSRGSGRKSRPSRERSLQKLEGNFAKTQNFCDKRKRK